jgi:transposase
LDRGIADRVSAQALAASLSGQRASANIPAKEHCRRIATRYDQLAANYLAFVNLAAIRIWLHACETVAWRALRRHQLLPGGAP